MSFRILTVSIQSEIDVVACRQRARQIASFCGFAPQDQTRIATAVSELARNVFNYGGGGKAEFSIEGESAPQVLLIRIEDKGPGIADLDLVLSGNYRSQTGMGVGLLGARRLMDQTDIQTGSTGTTIVLKKLMPHGAAMLNAADIGNVGLRLAAMPMDVTLAEVQQQNRELLAALAELKTRQEELLQLTQELQDTNRGVVALYAELDEKADHLRRADETKSRFLSNMSHEFRTPLSSIRALAKILLEGTDGDLSSEQTKQVNFILQGAESLSELVNDLLDLAKIEAGKVEVHPVHFSVSDVFSALRGMLRPLLVSQSVKLEFDEPGNDVPGMVTDEAKLSQILRNFISNALKFTEAGSVRVTAAYLAEEEAVRFSVIDTGLGIAAENHHLIFEEFSQVENRLQNKIKGTGLGLPLCRNLASLMGGRVELKSSPGEGSTFSTVIPVHYTSPESLEADMSSANVDDTRLPVLIVEDDQNAIYQYGKLLTRTPFRPMFARNLREAENLWSTHEPRAVVLDIFLRGENSWHWLAQLKNDPQRLHVPVVLATESDDRRKGMALGADAYFVKPLQRAELLATLEKLTQISPTAESVPADAAR